MVLISSILYNPSMSMEQYVCGCLSMFLVNNFGLYLITGNLQLVFTEFKELSTSGRSAQESQQVARSSESLGVSPTAAKKASKTSAQSDQHTPVHVSVEPVAKRLRKSDHGMVNLKNSYPFL